MSPPHSLIQPHCLAIHPHVSASAALELQVCTCGPPLLWSCHGETPSLLYLACLSSAHCFRGRENSLPAWWEGLTDHRLESLTPSHSSLREGGSKVRGEKKRMLYKAVLTRKAFSRLLMDPLRRLPISPLYSASAHSCQVDSHTHYLPLIGPHSWSIANHLTRGLSSSLLGEEACIRAKTLQFQPREAQIRTTCHTTAEEMAKTNKNST